MEENIKYYMRKSGAIVRVIDGVVLEYLNAECSWIPNQEWFVSMFVDGEDDYIEITKERVDKYINDKLNSKKMIR